MRAASDVYRFTAGIRLRAAPIQMPHSGMWRALDDSRVQSGFITGGSAAVRKSPCVAAILTRRCDAGRGGKVDRDLAAEREMSTEIPYRPFRETPIATEEDVQRMLARLRLRCKIGPKVQINGNSVEQSTKPNVVSETGVNQLPGAIAAIATPGALEPMQDSVSTDAESCRPQELLQWGKPVKEGFCTWSIKDSSGRYTVLKERSSSADCYQYIAFCGNTVLAPVCGTAERAKAHCQADADRR
jgi:hypothetical protein